MGCCKTCYFNIIVHEEGKITAAQEDPIGVQRLHHSAITPSLLLLMDFLFLTLNTML